jgi:uncharacterized protein YrrD
VVRKHRAPLGKNRTAELSALKETRMQRVSDLVNKKVFRRKVDRKGNERPVRFGRVHMAVFSPDGRRVAGFMVKLPDVVGMVKRPDQFVALDSLAVGASAGDEDGVVISREKGGMGDAAIERLGLDWDRCIIWAGMDAKTVSGRELGYVNDAVYDEKTGTVAKMCVGDGGVAQSLVGSVEIPIDMLRRYEKGFMIVDDAAAKLQLSGGVAAAAGEGYARAKAGGKQAAKKAGRAASSAVDKGSFALGRAIGKAKRAVSSAVSDDDGEKVGRTSGRASRDEAKRPAPVPAEQVEVSAPEAPEAISGEVDRKPKKVTYAPAAQVKGGSSKGAGKSAGAAKNVTAAKKPAVKKGSNKKAPRAVDAKAGKVGGMFGAFLDEYKKASK